MTDDDNKSTSIKSSKLVELMKPENHCGQQMRDIRSSHSAAHKLRMGCMPNKPTIKAHTHTNTSHCCMYCALKQQIYCVLRMCVVLFVCRTKSDTFLIFILVKNVKACQSRCQFSCCWLEWRIDLFHKIISLFYESEIENVHKTKESIKIKIKQ